MGKKIRVGAAQISPIFFDKKKTLEKTCDYIQEASRLGVDLLSLRIQDEAWSPTGPKKIHDIL